MVKAVKNITISKVLFVLATLAFVFIIVKCYSNDDFFSVNIIDTLTFYFTLIIAVIIVESQSKKEKFKQHAESLIVKFQKNFISNLTELIVENDEITTQNILCHIRKIRNQIELLKKYLDKINCSEDLLKRLEKSVENYLDILSDNISNISKSEQQINKYNEQIDYLCEQIIYSIYL